MPNSSLPRKKGSSRLKAWTWSWWNSPTRRTAWPRRAHKLDLGAFGTTAPLVHIAKGADIRIIGGVMGEDAAIIATPENAKIIKTIADFKGKKVATVRLATGDAVFRGALDEAGLELEDRRADLRVKEPAGRACGGEVRAGGCRGHLGPA